MRRTGRVAGAALAIALLGACGVPPERRAQVAGDASVPFDLLAPDADPVVPPVTAPEAEPVALCFVRNGRLAVTEVHLEPPVTLLGSVAALSDPVEAPEPLRTALSDTSVVGEVRLAAGIARVDLRRAISTLGGDDQLLAVAQIVCTLTARPGVGQVSFTLEGTPVDVPRGDGSLVAAPVSRDDYAPLLPAP